MQPHWLAGTAAIYAALALWFSARERLGRVGFYVIFAVAVTVSVQLVRVYLVFATLIVPPHATRRMAGGRLVAAWGLGIAGYTVGLVVSAIVWALVVLVAAWLRQWPRR